MSKLSLEAKLRMWEDLEALQETFPYTVDGLLSFAQICINELIPGSPDLISLSWVKIRTSGYHFRTL